MLRSPDIFRISYEDFGSRWLVRVRVGRFIGRVGLGFFQSRAMDNIS